MRTLPCPNGVRVETMRPTPRRMPVPRGRRAGPCPRTPTRSPHAQRNPTEPSPRPGRFKATCPAEATAWAGFTGAPGGPRCTHSQNQPPSPCILRAGTDPPCRPCGRRGQASRPWVCVDIFLCDQTGLGGGCLIAEEYVLCEPPQATPALLRTSPGPPSKGPREPALVPGGLSRSSDSKRPGHRPLRPYTVRVCRVCKGEFVGGCAGGRLRNRPPPPQPRSPRGHPPGPGPRSPPAGYGETKGQRQPEGPVLAGPGRSRPCSLHPARPTASSPHPEGCDCSMA